VERASTTPGFCLGLELSRQKNGKEGPVLVVVRLRGGKFWGRFQRYWEAGLKDDSWELILVGKRVQSTKRGGGVVKASRWRLHDERFVAPAARGALESVTGEGRSQDHDLGLEGRGNQNTKMVLRKKNQGTGSRGRKTLCTGRGGCGPAQKKDGSGRGSGLAGGAGDGLRRIKTMRSHQKAVGGASGQARLYPGNVRRLRPDKSGEYKQGRQNGSKKERVFPERLRKKSSLKKRSKKKRV